MLSYLDARSSITSSILPTRPPSLFPLVAIKLALSQFHVDRIMGLAHPFPKFISVANSWLVAVPHPRPEVIRAYPTWVHLAEQPDELFCLSLLRK